MLGGGSWAGVCSWAGTVARSEGIGESGSAGNVGASLGAGSVGCAGAVGGSVAIGVSMTINEGPGGGESSARAGCAVSPRQRIADPTTAPACRLERLRTDSNYSPTSRVPTGQAHMECGTIAWTRTKRPGPCRFYRLILRNPNGPNLAAAAGEPQRVPAGKEFSTKDSRLSWRTASLIPESAASSRRTIDWPPRDVPMASIESVKLATSGGAFRKTCWFLTRW